MHFLALASDYDGTLADDGNIADATWDALRRLQTSGRKLILVTGRSFADLARALPQFDAFDGIVAENGAILYCPAGHRTVPLSSGLPNSLVERLQLRKVEPLWIGDIILATRIENTQEILEAVRQLDLELGIPAQRVVSIGDGENDRALFESTGCGVAVANAPAIVKKTADLVTEGASGAGVSELIDRVIATDLAEVKSCIEGRRADIARMAA